MGMPSAARHTARSPGRATSGAYRLGPRESLPRCWIGGGRMHLLDEITAPNVRDR